MLCPYVQVIAIIIVQGAFKADASSSLCNGNSSYSRSLAISVSSKTDSGSWMDSSYGRAEHSNSLSNVSVDILHNVTECSGRRVIHIQGFIRNVNSSSDQPTSGFKVPIVFHSKHGTNVLVSNSGRTIEKKNLGEDNNGVTFTNRALEDNEVFEVRLDQKGGRTSQSFGIGILTKNPEDVEILPHMHFSEYAWMYHNDAIYNKNTERRSRYGQNLNGLPVGTKFGVMKKPSGDIHFFVNQVDQGSAVSGISGPVYGIVELWNNAEKVTIVAP